MKLKEIWRKVYFVLIFLFAIVFFVMAFINVYMLADWLIRCPDWISAFMVLLFTAVVFCVLILVITLAIYIVEKMDGE